MVIFFLTWKGVLLGKVASLLPQAVMATSNFLLYDQDKIHQMLL
jgi:hypothetical protein